MTTPPPSELTAAQLRTVLQTYIQLQAVYDARVVASLRSASNNITRRLDILARVDGVGAAVRSQQLRKTQAAIHNEMAKHWVRTGALTRAGQEQAAAAAARTQLDPDLWGNVLNKDGLAYMQQSLAATAARGIDTLETRLSGQSYVPLSESVYRQNLVTNGKIDQIINDALARGASAQELAKDVKAYVDPATPGGVRYASLRLARTEINNAFHAQQIRSAKDQPWTTGVQWHLSGSHATPDECNRYAEETHFRGGDPGVYKPDDVPPKPHPACLCFLTTVDVDREKFTEEFNKGKYDSWLEQQGAGAKDNPTRGALANGALAFATTGAALLAVAAVRRHGFGIRRHLPGVVLAERRLTPHQKATVDRYLSQDGFDVDDWLRRPPDGRTPPGFFPAPGGYDEWQLTNLQRSRGDDLSLLPDLEQQKIRKQIADLDALIAAQPALAADMTVYRDTGEDVFRGLNLFDTFTHKGYTSTSHDLPDAGEMGRVLEFRIPRGSKVLDLGEQGVILPRDATFKVVRIHGDRLILEYDLAA